MVAAQQVDLLGETQLQQQHQRHHLDAELSAVHVIAQEEVLLRLRAAETLENVEQVEVLPVDVADHREGRFEGQQIGLLFCVAEGLRRRQEVWARSSCRS